MPSAPTLTAATDYLGLTPEQRYAVISQKFPVWLLAEPIVFPKNDRTYGWACHVPGCEAAPAQMSSPFFCWGHTHQYRDVKDSVSVEEFLRQAKPWRSMLGRGAHEAGRLPNLWNYAKYNDENMTRHLQRVGPRDPAWTSRELSSFVPTT